ncbi:class II fumarate hydratase [Paucibacter sp. Y2R2-4]|uniref:class II fumarate hydratase n=1 Tax=Paucibacter sp. Y2R2-4 TaxID=2893553 RepID=UPI0021E383C7|nr:class II fumarate hydratase [Paucibacter sp. Y2R2-4]MCV2352254.1 class II fumarate hydratase [Paucibacter sp. Y2R2-4]
MKPSREESDSLGSMEVPGDALWGAQTARSLRFFKIGLPPGAQDLQQRMPSALLQAMAWIKWAAALVNQDLGLLEAPQAQAIAAAAREVAEGGFAAQFPLSVWQTGSGTQSHMNLNEVLANLASQAIGGGMGLQRSVDPHAQVNLGQSSNDVFPSAMHLAAALRMQQSLLPALARLQASLHSKAAEWAMLIKIGRTHAQDATPVTLGQEFGAYAAQLQLAEQALRSALPALHQLAIGGTAVGTGLNTHAEFGPRVIARLNDQLAPQLALSLSQASNLMAALSGHEALVGLHSGLKMLAIALTKMACDIRWMGSGPRAGLGELRLPENEPGSSIMPGKINPTQVEALTMVCAQVMGHDAAIGFAASQGQFELNAYKPLIIFNVLDSLNLLSDAMDSFEAHCLRGLQACPARIDALLQASLMLVTALVPHIGYAGAAAIAQQAESSGSSLRQAALDLGGLSAEDFDAWVDPRVMLAPNR